MCKLVQNRDHTALSCGISHLGPENVVLYECHGSCIFHCAGVELRDEKLVIFFKRVWIVKKLLVEIKTLLGLLEDVIRIHIFGQGLTAKDP